jgi:hypothetical protein
MEEFKEWLADIKRRVVALEKNLGIIRVLKVATDPTDPLEGDIWYNTTSHTWKGKKNSGVVTFDTTP